MQMYTTLDTEVVNEIHFVIIHLSAPFAVSKYIFNFLLKCEKAN